MQSSSQIVTNKPTPSFFYRPDVYLVLLPSQQCWSTEGIFLSLMSVLKIVELHRNGENVLLGSYCAY